MQQGSAEMRVMMRERNVQWQKIWRVFSIAALVLVCGLGWNAGHASAETTGDWSGAKKAVISAYQSYKTEVDVSSYNLNYETEYEELKNMMSQVVNETPYIFYAATSYTVSRNSNTNQIVKIGLGYTDEYKKEDGTVRKTKIKNTRAKLDAAINEALACVEPGMTKLEKALVLHDYIIRNTTYAKNNKQPYRLTEIGVFLKHKANCQGYSLAYGILMEKIGVPVQYVSSDEMSHMWNMIRIGKQWYHVDVTWDDPVDANESLDQYGLVKHDNFLCSSAKFEKNGHYGFDIKTAVTTKYDNKYWKNITSSFYHYNGKWIYLTKSGITEREKIVGGSKKVLYNVGGKSLVEFKAGKYYFIAYNSIYLYDYNANSAEQVWKTANKYSDEYSLTQIKFSNGYLYYRLLIGESHVNGKLNPDEDGMI